MPHPAKMILAWVLAGLVMLLAPGPAPAQQETTKAPAAPPATPAPPKTYKMTTPIPPSIPIPDKVETRFGTLNFFDGVPDKAWISSGRCRPISSACLR
jgi:hypothetical protein